MLIDSHCHLQMIDTGALHCTLDDIVQKAIDNQVEHLLCVGTNLHDRQPLCDIAEQYSGISCSVGLHPNDSIDIEPTIESLIDLANHPKIIAIGETGLDYYRQPVDTTLQQKRFRTHILASLALKKPLIIHARAANEDLLGILRSPEMKGAFGVFHCFTEDWATAKAGLDLGFTISFSGIVTFNKAHNVHEVVKQVPLERMLIETDSPYLAPVPYRGKINQPAYVKEVAQAIALLKGISYERVAEQTTQNFYDVFGKGDILAINK